MGGRRLLWQLFLPYVAVSLLSLGAVALFASHSVRQFYHAEVAEDVEARALLLREQIAPLLAGERYAAIDSLCRILGRRLETRITVLLADGRTVGDSDGIPGNLSADSPGPPQEITRALAGEIGTSRRHSAQLEAEAFLVAVPIYGRAPHQPQVVGVVRAALPLTRVDRALGTLYLEIIFGAVLVACVLAAVSLRISGRISAPLEMLQQGAERFAAGDLDRRLPMPSLKELRSLTASMNQMAGDLRERLDQITRQRNELDAILRSMVEGVLAVDTRGHVTNMNAACVRMLALDPERVRGKHTQEVLRNPALQELISRVIAGEEPVEGDVIVHNGGERFLKVYGTILTDAGGRRCGAVLAMNDVTRVRQLERMRRDFVANVSHELKTPITSIKGAAETLLEGAIEDPDHAERFLSIIARQGNRLHAIVEDLLTLSRLEDEAGRESVELQRTSMEVVLAGAVQSCLAQAEEKEIKIELSCPPDLIAVVSARLLENAVVNLIDNAIKYSEPGSRVMVAGMLHDGEILLSVTDEGAGIDRRYHGRIFERFFRVDRARSRSMGGTGLGLAIVKHIALAHGGRVMVESTPGEGSTFGISLPRPSDGKASR